MCAGDERLPEVIKNKTFKNQLQVFSEISQWLIKQTQAEPEGIIMTLEATGVYHEGLTYYLNEKGFKLLVSKPDKAKKFAQSIGLTHKTDKSDALM